MKISGEQIYGEPTPRELHFMLRSCIASVSEAYAGEAAAMYRANGWQIGAAVVFGQTETILGPVITESGLIVPGLAIYELQG